MAFAAACCRAWLAVAFCFVAVAPLQASQALHEVVVTGRGTTEDEALKAAFVVALERTVGTIIHSSTVSRDFRIESDVQMLLTNGCIDSYDEISSDHSAGIFSMTIRARVRSGAVADWMRRSGWTGEVDLDDTWARLATSIRSRRQALEMLHEKMPAIRDALYKVVPVDLATGAQAGWNSVSPPFTEENLDGRVVCVWGAALQPDHVFWDTHAAPLLAACFETLCEKKARLFVNMDTGKPQTTLPIERAPEARWRRFEPAGNRGLPDARPVVAPRHARNCIALETRSAHSGSLDLSLYFFTDEIFHRILNPPEKRDAEGNRVSMPERLNDMRSGLRATIVFSDGSQNSFTVTQAAPLFQTLQLPWSGGVSATYCGPHLFPSMYRGGWEDKSHWPDWQGAVKPQRRVPGFGNFLVHRGRIYSAGGDYGREFENIGKPDPFYSQGGGFLDWRTASEVIVPVVFTLDLDQLRKIQRLALEPVTGPPPMQPSLGEGLRKLFKSLLD